MSCVLCVCWCSCFYIDGTYVCLLVFSSPDSSQNDSLSDQEDHRPGFSMPSISFDAQDTDASDTSKFSMYNSVSQKLMVMYQNSH